MALVLDTGPLYASLDKDDKHHAASASLLTSRPASEHLVIPAPVLVEACYWIEKYLQPKDLAAFLRDVASGAYQVECLISADYARAAELVDKYRDSELGFVDATVVAIVERLRETKVASLDHRHFSMIRFSHSDQVELVPTSAE